MTPDPEVVDTKGAQVPFELRSVRAEVIAELLDYSKEHFLQRVACLPDAPKRCSKPGQQPRWKVRDWLEWQDRQQQAG